MDIERAKELLTTLAGGVNPLTGEVLPPDDSCNQVEIVRAINTLLRAVDNQEKRPQRPLPENAGKPWIKADEDTLCKMFDEGYTRKEICDHFKRSSGAIASRLVKLGKIKERDEFRNR